MASAAAVQRGSGCQSSAGSKDDLGRGNMLESKEQWKALALFTRARGVFGPDPPGDPPACQRHLQPCGARVRCQCQTRSLWGMLFQRPAGTATAEPQTSKHWGGGAVGGMLGGSPCRERRRVHPGLKGK